MSPTDAKHIRVLDGLRGISIFWVLIHHLPFPSGLLPSAIEAVRARGELGVEVFFALSGFLVTRSLEQCHARGALQLRSGAREFAIRRVARIWPPYFLSLFLIGIFILLDRSGRAHGISAGMSISWSIPTFLANYMMPLLPDLPHIGTPLTRAVSNIWSVCFEEQFYLVLLLLYLWTGKRYWKWMVALGIGSVLLRLGVTSIYPDTRYQVIHMMTHFRFDAIAWGCGAWFMRDRLKEAVGKSRLFRVSIFGLTVFAIWFFRHREPLTAFDASLELAVVAPAFTFLMILILNSQSLIRRFLETEPMVLLGQWSYELYLIHGLVIWAVFKLVPQVGLALGLSIPACLIAAWAFHSFFGHPARAFILDWFGAEKRPIQAPVAGT